MRIIYTTEHLKIEGVEVYGIDALPFAKQQWIVENRRRLQATATLPEGISATMLARFDDRPVRQAFFMIRKRSYFLDFFFPKHMIAVEIDGSSHKYRREKDRRRDNDFRSIGIRTIRISNKDVMNGHLLDKLFSKLYKTK